MKAIYLLIPLLLLACKAEKPSVNFQTEEKYKLDIQSKIGGKLEVTVKNGRVDLLTNEVAYEVSWANEWKDAIGKALWYGLQTHRESGIILIMKEPSDYKYASQLKSTIAYFNGNKKVHVLLYPDDFK